MKFTAEGYIDGIYGDGTATDHVLRMPGFNLRSGEGGFMLRQAQNVDGPINPADDVAEAYPSILVPGADPYAPDPGEGDPKAYASVIDEALRESRRALVSSNVEMQKKRLDRALTATGDTGASGDPRSYEELMARVRGAPIRAWHGIESGLRGMARPIFGIDDLIQTDILGIPRHLQSAFGFGAVSSADMVRISRAQAEGAGIAGTMIYEAAPYVMTAMISGPLAAGALSAGAIGTLPGWLKAGAIMVLSDMPVDFAIGFLEVPFDPKEDSNPLQQIAMLHNMAKDPRAPEWVKTAGAIAASLGITMEDLPSVFIENDDDHWAVRRLKRAFGEMTVGVGFNLALFGVGAGAVGGAKVAAKGAKVAAKGAKLPFAPLFKVLEDVKRLGRIGSPDEISFFLRYQNKVAESLINDGTAIWGMSFRRAVYGEKVDLPQEAMPALMMARSQVNATEIVKVSSEIAADIDEAVSYAARATPDAPVPLRQGVADPKSWLDDEGTQPIMLQWYRNAEGGQQYGNQSILVPAGVEAGDDFLGNRIGNLTAEEVLERAYGEAGWDGSGAPHWMHLYRRADQDTWQFSGFSYEPDASDILGSDNVKQWAKRVSDFDSPEAVAHGRTADSAVVGSSPALNASDPKIDANRELDGMFLRENPLPVQATGGSAGTVITNQDLARTLTEAHMKQYGRKLDPVKNKRDYTTVKNRLRKELAAQLEHLKNGADWYTKDIEDAFYYIKQIVPIRNEQEKDLFWFFTAVTSQQTDVLGNLQKAIDAYEQWVKTGEIPTLKQNGMQFGVMTQKLQAMQWLLKDEFGGDIKAMMEFMLTPISGREIRDLMAKSGLFSKNYKPDGILLDEMYIGANALGPKIGNFWLNISGYDHNAVTLDLWAWQGYNRYIGRLLDVGQKDLAAGKIASQGRGPGERATLMKMYKELGDEFRMDPDAVQATMWIFEKRLYEAHHAYEAQEETFSGAAKREARARGISVDGDDPAPAGGGGAVSGSVQDGGVGSGGAGKDASGDLQLELFEKDPEMAKIIRDPEGRELTAKIIVGITQPGRAPGDTSLDTSQVIAVARAAADAITLRHPADPAMYGLKGFFSAKSDYASKKAYSAWRKAWKAHAKKFGVDAAGKPDPAPSKATDGYVSPGDYTEISLGDPLKRTGGAQSPTDKALRKLIEERAEDGHDLIFTLAHETGHAIDRAHAGISKFLEKLQGTHSVGIWFDVRDEMHVVSRMVRPHLWEDNGMEIILRENLTTAYFPGRKWSDLTEEQKKKIKDFVDVRMNRRVAYREKEAELIADSLAMYMLAPTTFKSVAPKTAEMIRRMVNDHDYLKKTIQFAAFLLLGIPVTEGIAPTSEDEPDA